jgi:hypothetical protein
MPGWTNEPFTAAQRLQAFFEKVVVCESSCHEFMGGRNPEGYGNFWDEGKCKKAHRFAWEAFFGPIPEGVLVRHTCDNPPCCNPDHLVLGSDADNSQDKVDRGRMAPTHGAYNPAAILTENLAREVIAYSRHTTWTLQAIADKFKISKSHVSNIKDGRTWRHLYQEITDVAYID